MSRLSCSASTMGRDYSIKSDLP